MRERTTLLLFTGLIMAVMSVITACAGGKVEARNAVSVLKKVQAATQVGVNYEQYSQLVIESKTAVNEASSKLSNGELKRELQATMDAYADAGEGWSKCEQSDPTIIGRINKLPLKSIATGDDTGQRLRRKYNIKTLMEDLSDKSLPDSGDGMFSVDSLEQRRMLNTIWKEAEKHLKRASDLAT